MGSAQEGPARTIAPNGGGVESPMLTKRMVLTAETVEMVCLYFKEYCITMYDIIRLLHC